MVDRWADEQRGWGRDVCVCFLALEKLLGTVLFREGGEQCGTVFGNGAACRSLL